QRSSVFGSSHRRSGFESDWGPQFQNAARSLRGQNCLRWCERKLSKKNAFMDEQTITKKRGITMNILLAEDDDSISKITKMTLELIGKHKVTVASDGQQAFELATQNDFDL